MKTEFQNTKLRVALQKSCELRVATCEEMQADSRSISRITQLASRKYSASGISQFLLLVAIVLVCGCESTAGKESGSVQDRQDSAVKDPFSYGPTSHDPKKAPAGPSKEHPGDGTAKTEWDRFWNP